MKKLLFILVVMFSFNNVAIYAHKENNAHAEIALTSSERKEPINKEHGPITRSIFQTAYAYLYNNVVCIDFNEELPTAIISIIKESTGETVYIETYIAPTNTSICLDGEYSGNYLIKIEFDDVLLYGGFSL